jgi:hypothetical protein
MLLRMLFAVLMLATLAGTIVQGAYALARASLARQALLVAHDQIASSAALAQARLASAIAAGADPRIVAPVAPSPLATCVLASRTGCALEGEASISFSAVPAGTASPCPNGTCTAYLQANDRVDEGHIEATVTARTIAGGGTVLAARSATIVFRTFRSAPYAALAGGSDHSMLAPLAGGAGDDGGTVPSGTAPGSLIDVLYQNQLTGAVMPANVWQPAVQRATGSAPSWTP